MMGATHCNDNYLTHELFDYLVHLAKDGREANDLVAASWTSATAETTATRGASWKRVGATSGAAWTTAAATRSAPRRRAWNLAARVRIAHCVSSSARKSARRDGHHPEGELGGLILLAAMGETLVNMPTVTFGEAHLTPQMMGGTTRRKRIPSRGAAVRGATLCGTGRNSYDGYGKGRGGLTGTLTTHRVPRDQHVMTTILMQRADGAQLTHLFGG